MDSKNFAIGLLSTTAVILLVGVLIIQSRPAPALASGMTASAGRYVITVGTRTIGDEEFVFVIDTSSEKMIIYRFNSAKLQIELIQGISLKEMRAATDGVQQPPPPSKRGGRRRP